MGRMTTLKRPRKAAPAGSSTTKKPDSRDRPRETVLSLKGPDEWRAWLASNHADAGAVLLRIAKKQSAGALTYPAALEAALAWGWIDSQKRALDDDSWLQRFTRRGPRSPWSKINRAKAEALMAAGRMEPPGLREVERAKQDGRWKSAYAGAKVAKVPKDLAAALAKNARARAFFEALDSANRYAILYRVETAKRPETRARRVATFVAMCAAHETIHPPRTPRPRSPIARGRG
jgi:uncharacterized protein YdeI (YjbR/CyaY-like superfamily)